MACLFDQNVHSEGQRIYHDRVYAKQEEFCALEMEPFHIVYCLGGVVVSFVKLIKALQNWLVVA
jgi:hypothetical protein